MTRRKISVLTTLRVITRPGGWSGRGGWVISICWCGFSLSTRHNRSAIERLMGPYWVFERAREPFSHTYSTHSFPRPSPSPSTPPRTDPASNEANLDCLARATKGHCRRRLLRGGLALDGAGAVDSSSHESSRGLAESSREMRKARRVPPTRHPFRTIN